MCMVFYGVLLVQFPRMRDLRRLKRFIEKGSFERISSTTMRTAEENTSEPRTVFGRFLRSFAIGNENYQLLEATTGKQQSPSETRNLMKDAIMLMFFFSGIQCTLVMMGFLQERIITRGYSVHNSSVVDQFGDAQFLVFCNRVVAMVVCAIVLMLTWRRLLTTVSSRVLNQLLMREDDKDATATCAAAVRPLVHLDIEHHVHMVPTICKTSKVVVTMLMGLVLRGQRYSWQEWGCGGAVGLGASLFLLSSGRSRAEGVVTSISGMFLMIGYLLFDSYTLNYQKKLFDKKPKISKYQFLNIKYQCIDWADHNEA
ncbi:UAA transporter family protein [Ancylostoma duodenale]|uniref:Adenosine 3'-phospho 5'-phosphosulfate transporter 1 n=1 Tax=Ancylostoma duodenale TaxID=51022 RepID=A0A0C2H0F6_9BILA|nr:UAA transporter family protein [Ancylostoma duodenale]